MRAVQELVTLSAYSQGDDKQSFKYWDMQSINQIKVYV